MLRLKEVIRITPLLLLTVPVLTAQATLVVFQWTPTQIFLAADSMVAKISPQTGNRVTIKGAFQCKIHQVGNIFFAIIGTTDDAAIKVDLVPIAKRAALTKGGILEKESRFEVLAKEQI